jgi:hypothetical protein
MSKFASILSLVLGALLVVGLVLYRVWAWDAGFGDSAFLTQLAENIAYTGKPVSQISASFDEVFARTLAGTADEILSHPLKIQSVVEFYYFKWHVYAILYLIAPLVFAFGGKLVLSALTALSFAVLPCGAYYYLRRKELSHWSCLLVALLLISHPAWSISVQGQLYADRLFLCMGFVLFLLLDDPEKNRIPVLALLLIGSTVSERFGLILGGSVIVYLAIRRAPIKANLTIYLASVVVAAISIFLLKFFITHPSNASFASSMTPRAFLANYQGYPGFASKLWCFLLINGVFALFAMKNWRLLAIAILTSLPNIIGNIGGAEKTGYLTHYHSTYFPILAAAIVTSAGALRGGPIELSLRTAHMLFFLTIGNTAPSVSLKNVTTVSGPATLWNDITSLYLGAKGWEISKYREIGRAIKPRSNVVTLEALMPTLYPDAANIQMYPLGIDDANYLVLPWSQPITGGPYEFPASYSFLGPEERKKQDNLFAVRLRELGFNLDQPKIIGAWAILSKPERAVEKTINSKP